MNITPKELINLCTCCTNPTELEEITRLEIVSRLVNLDISPYQQDIKTFPSRIGRDIFLLIWHIHNHRVDASLCPLLPHQCASIFYSPEARTQTLTHDYIELAYVVSGTFRQLIMGQLVTFQTGELCLIDKNCLHQDVLGEQEAIILFLGISDSMFQNIIWKDITTHVLSDFLKSALHSRRNLRQYLRLYPSEAENSSILVPYMYQLLWELWDAHPDAGSALICQGLLFRIFHILGNFYHFDFSNHNTSEDEEGMADKILTYMRLHYQDICANDLSREFHFQTDYFNRVLRKQTGLTYSEMLQNIRLEKARELLLTSNLQIEVIAEQVGYQNRGYFYKIFQSHYGMTPFRYRKQYKDSL